MNKLVAVGIIVVLALIAIMLTLPSPREEPANQQTQAPPPEQQAPTTGEALTIELTAVDNRFQPDTIKVAPGQKLVIVIENKGSRFHTFTIDELGVDVPLNPGDRKTVEITVPEDVTELTFYCRPHKAIGMVGTLTVS